MTTVTTGLIGALRAAGHRAAPVQGGPDFTDLAIARWPLVDRAATSTRTSWAPDLVPRLFAAGSAGADIAVVEGVMGLLTDVSDPTTKARPSPTPIRSRTGRPPTSPRSSVPGGACGRRLGAQPIPWPRCTDSSPTIRRSGIAGVIPTGSDHPATNRCGTRAPVCLPVFRGDRARPVIVVPSATSD